jgi:hypothetical protein
MKVFLGGTVNGSMWRQELISLLDPGVDYFDPVVDSWDNFAILEENRQKELCDFNLFVITPKIKGVYSIAEVVDCSNKNPSKTLFCLLKQEGTSKFSPEFILSLEATMNIVCQNGVSCFYRLDRVADFLNKSC